MTIRVLVADDQHLMRAGLRGIVDAAAGLTVVAEAANGLQAVTLARRHCPDVVLMDIRMPELDGIEATRVITGDTPARVLVLTTFDLDEYVYAALRAGASGFLLKDTAPADLHTAIRVVAAGDALLAPGVTRRLIAEFAARPGPVAPGAGVPPGWAAVTGRERQVLALVAEGLSNAEIGARLHITAGTAKTHVGSLLTKLDARDRVQLVVLAYRGGLVPLR
ncbi:LuxR family transcriptional regulator [Actinoplanes sp. SE50]|uniref:response regulator n=1 Tax=unclassified Actinoplanes TaxID=2626549 RepID=UPI00023ECA0D|nr:MULTISPECIES: response regulator transcription factor [unclassified Actinoplanes]AEV87092.1 Response regulator gacA [Actinoplanes sp. SE50/110]ATO85490.1 LuxR family transcriptional regulator [Actinoplanes sp. SE50]SLM02902.1 two-component system response regulator [Actinoplanes sp. SE50/110]